MPRARLAVALLAALLGLAACGTPQPTPYQPAGAAGGYAERPIAGGLVEVVFRGNTVTPPERVEAYALYRAAEIAANRGADRLAVLDKTVRENRREVRDYDPWPGYVGYGNRSGVGFGYSVPVYRSRTYSYTTYTAELLVRPLPPGVAPTEPAPLYDVGDLLQRLGPSIQRPLPPPPP
jgi:hypothetical protein